MPSTYTASNRFEKPADGEQSATWGDTVDRQFDLIDLAMSGITQVTTTGGTTTLTANNGVDDQARRAILVLLGNLTSNATIVFPAVSKVLVIDNQTTGPFNVTFAVAGGSSLTLPAGYGGVLISDGGGIDIIASTQAFNNIGLLGTLYAGASSPVFSSSVGTQIDIGTIQIASAAGKIPLYLSAPPSGGPATLLAFYGGNAADFVGYISTDGGSVSYNITSDYRAKTGLEPLVGATTRFVGLKTYRGRMKRKPDRTIDTMVAHEIALVVPEAVTGEKDAVDGQGKPILQAVDYSKVVPLLVATLLETIERQGQLERRIARLEAAE